MSETIAVVGATLTGNKGAEGMLRGCVEAFGRRRPEAKFLVLSMYPEADVACTDDARMEIVANTNAGLFFLTAPLSLLMLILRALRLPAEWLCFTRALRAIRRSQLVVDLSGISFVDGRGVVLLYNVVLLLPALALGKPLIKFAQACGPFKRRINRWLAAMILPKLARVIARGKESYRHLIGIGLSNVECCADMAFAFTPRVDIQRQVAARVKAVFSDGPTVVVSPSSQVKANCTRRGIDYVQICVEFVDWLVQAKDKNVVVIAHAARPGSLAKKNNDLPVCQAIMSRISDPIRVRFVLGGLSAEVLRSVIAQCELAVVSRFHAMVSALCVGVPPLVVGWSHKYAEVLDQFELEHVSIDFAEISLGKLKQHFERVARDAAEIRASVIRCLPQVKRSTERNVDIAVSVLQGIQNGRA